MSTDQKEAILARYGGKIRVRVSGLLVIDGKLLLLKHRGLGTAGYLWLPPGGGVDFGESLADALKREFIEETGLSIQVGERKFIYEFRHERLHAIELFYEVFLIGNQELALGSDPEFPQHLQLIHDFAWMNQQELDELPTGTCHTVIEHYQNLDVLMRLKNKRVHL